MRDPLCGSVVATYVIVSILRELLNNIVRTAEELGTHHILVPFHYIRESTVIAFSTFCPHCSMYFLPTYFKNILGKV